MWISLKQSPIYPIQMAIIGLSLSSFYPLYAQAYVETQEIREVLQDLKREHCNPEELDSYRGPVHCNALEIADQGLADAKTASEINHQLTLLNRSKPSWGKREIPKLIDHWMGAKKHATYRHRLGSRTFQFMDLLPTLICVEARKDTWRNSCLNAQQYPFLIQDSGCFIAIQEKYYSTGVTFGPFCSDMRLIFPGAHLGKGSTKQTHVVHLLESQEYPPYYPIAMQSYHIPYRFMDPAHQAKVDTEISILGIIQSNPQEGLPRVYSADTSYLMVEYFPSNLEVLLDQYQGHSLMGENWKSLAAQINHALVFLHSQGVILEDIKPANILFDPGRPAYLTSPSDHPRLALADFDLSKNFKALYASSAPHFPEKGPLAGTLLYFGLSELMQGLASPGKAPTLHYVGETYDEVLSYEQKKDIYAWGLILYEMKKGKPAPWQLDENSLNFPMFRKSLFLMNPTESALLRASDDPFDQLIGWTIDPDPKRRPTSQALSTAFDTLLHWDPTHGNPPSVLPDWEKVIVPTFQYTTDPQVLTDAHSPKIKPPKKKKNVRQKRERESSESLDKSETRDTTSTTSRDRKPKTSNRPPFDLL